MVRAYNPHTDEAFLNKAYVFAMRAHGTQKRVSGDPYFSHPVEVAAILTRFRPDDQCIAAALLHDTIEDTSVTREELCALFGEETARMVDGVTKLSRLEATEHLHNSTPRERELTKQAENFRKLLLAVADDIRILLIKLADRVHNMRTLHFITSNAKRQRIARETLELYAPLAGRIGLLPLQEELEDLAFAALDGDARLQIVQKINALNAPTIIKRVEGWLSNALHERTIEAQVKGRVKTPYSIFRKMQQRQTTFENITDVIGFRIVTRTLDECYRALGVVHSLRPCVSSRFKDYISIPKRNGYQSLHTEIVDGAKRLEIQIRTDAMHSAAEQGFAAHWHYKEDASKQENPQNYLWIRDLLEYVSAGGGSAVDLLEHTKLEIYHDQVFCFTPKGRLIGLPRGAGAIDFAYAVHTNVGNTCVGARINGVRVPLRTQIQNGDTVEIVCDTKQTPAAAWESMVLTGRAKTAVRRFLAQRNREQYVALGRTLLTQVLHEARPHQPLPALTPLAKKLKLANEDELLQRIGRGQIRPASLLPLLLNEKIVADESLVALEEGSLPASAPLQVCSICHPLPGDEVLVQYNDNAPTAVHRSSCPYAARGGTLTEFLADISPQQNVYTCILSVEILNAPGALGAVASRIGQSGGNIINCTVREAMSEFLVFRIEAEVHDLDHLHKLMHDIRQMSETAAVARL